jgi:hypothetical protein
MRCANSAAAWLIVVLSALAGAGCGSTATTARYDPKTQFHEYRTYTIRRGPVVTDDALTAVPDQLVQDRIDTAIREQLAAKGLRPAGAEPPDLIVSYSARARDRQELVDDQFGGQPPEVITGDAAIGGSDLSLAEYREVTLVLDLLDATTQQPIWHSTTQLMNHDLHDPQFGAKTLDKALEDFPPKPEK